MTKVECVACRHRIDASAKLCPYCGADPRTGERVDTQALLEETFHPREITTSESILEYARQRQWLVIVLASTAVVLLLGGLNSFLNHRNARETSDQAAVPLTEVVDTTTEQEQQQSPMPELQFQFDGRPQTMRTYLMEPGAVAPASAQPAQPAQATQAAPGRAGEPALRTPPYVGRALQPVHNQH